jgi:hypothetical protein
MFTVTGSVMKTFLQPGVVDKETGNVSPPTPKVQIMGEMPVQGGEVRLDMVTLTVENQNVYESLRGKIVRVPLGFFSPKSGQIIYFIPKGSVPEVVKPMPL